MDRIEKLQSFQKKPVVQKAPAILEYCKNKEVLDIGCIGQDNSPENPDWLHGKIKQVAANLTGIDTNIEFIEDLRKRGFRLYTPDTFEKDEQPEPDIIVMADVIEHISDIVSFLSFYKRFATEKTLIVISTPNPFSIRQCFNIFLFGRPGINPEHTVAIDPTNMLEILARAELELVDFKWLHEYNKPKKLYNRFLFKFYCMLYRCRKFWAPNYLIVVKLPAS